jgi:hypothetical protein
MGFPITPHQISVLGSAKVKEQSTFWRASDLEKSRFEEIVAEAKRIIDAHERRWQAPD